ncbi:MAG TPA: ATP-binding protein [Streptosporangiaceae bacterium]|nr:ATP-binding protein [Streptosporangiaceae bacterium]
MVGLSASTDRGSSLTIQLLPRQIAGRALEYLRSFRVVIINGPRQSGKTTLLHQLNQTLRGTYLSLDVGPLRAAAQADPAVFIANDPRLMMIDEIQRGGDDLVLAIKSVVDEDPARGQFVLAGSTRFLSTPSLSESLAGRAGILEVWPFAQQELAGAEESFIERAFADPGALRDAPPSVLDRRDYFGLICRGGYPEPNAMSSALARDEWYHTYVQAIIDTDIREMARIEAPGNMRRLLNLAAAATAQELNTVKVASDLQLHRATVNNYLSLLETVFLIRHLPAWSPPNLMARAVRRPKLHLSDTGLAAHLLGVDADGLAARIAPSRGPLVESFIVNEIAKQARWASFPVRLHHWRVSQGPEVDLVVERGNGRVIGLEAKATDAISQDDFRGLAALRERLGDNFIHGFVLYTGDRSLSFGDRLTALPISAIWDR